METSNNLHRIEEGKVLTGVCNGLAEYFKMDVNTVRILYVIVSLFSGLPIILYIVFSFALPVKALPNSKKDTSEDEYAYNEDDYKL